MATIRIVLGIICLIALGCSTEPGSGVLKGYELCVTGYRFGCIGGCGLCVMSYGEKGYGLCVMSYGEKNKEQDVKPKHPVLLLNTNYFLLNANYFILNTNYFILNTNYFILRTQPTKKLTNQQRNILLSAQPRNTQHITRNTLLTIARSQIGIREATGNNDGPQVAAYLKVTNLPKGNPWCAAFITWVFKQAGFDKPRTAWSPALFPVARRTTAPKPADVLGIYSLKLKRIAHAGLVERQQGNWIISIEGNTNANGGREGDGVYRKWRHLKTIKYFANWLKGV